MQIHYGTVKDNLIHNQVYFVQIRRGVCISMDQDSLNRDPLPSRNVVPCLSGLPNRSIWFICHIPSSPKACDAFLGVRGVGKSLVYPDSPLTCCSARGSVSSSQEELSLMSSWKDRVERINRLHMHDMTTDNDLRQHSIRYQH
jgi:hypothetical protein